MSRATEEAIAAVPLAYNSLDGHEVSRKKDEGPSKEPNSGSQTYPYQEIWDRTYKPRPKDPSRRDPTYTHKELKIKCRSMVEVKNFEEKGILPPNISAKARKKVEEFQAKRREEEKKIVEKILKDAWNTLMHCYDDEESQSIDSEETCPADDI